MKEPKLTFIEALRLRPAMYIGSTSIRGFNHLLSEITQYGFEELAARKFVFRILGNWRGEIVFGDFCTPFVDSIVQDWIPKNRDGNFEYYELLALNALSSSFKLTIKNENDSERTLNFVRGTLASGEITGRESRASEVRIDFELDRSIFDLDSQLNPYFYLDFMKTLAVLNRGRTIVYGFPDDEGTSEVKLKFENGLYDLLEIEKLRSIWDGYYLSTHIEFQSKDCEAEIAFSVWENPTNLPFQVSFVNHAISPENGVHFEAVIESVRSTLNKYLREHFDKSELDRISERAIRRALNCAIHVKMARPHFEGSYKGKLLSPEIIKPIKDAVSTKLLADLNNDGSQAIEMVKYLSRNATLNQR